MQTDPIGYKDQMNLYAYVGNDPLNATDPSGLTCEKDQDGKIKGCYVDAEETKDENGNVSTVQRKDLSGDALREFDDRNAVVNKEYTAAAKRLESLGSDYAAVDIESARDKGRFTIRVRASELKEELAQRVVIAANYEKTGVDTASGKTFSYLAGTSRFGGQNTTRLYKGFAHSGPADIRRTFVHEALHGSDAERRAFPDGWDPTITGLAHSSRYDLIAVKFGF